jgi:hypothetical protein
MRTYADLFVALLFAVWFLLTAVGQLGVPLARRIRSWDVCMLLPSFRFFAPTPSVHDLHLLYRDHLASGGVTRWYEVPAARPPQWINPVWNPGRRQNKALFDTTQHLARQINENRASPKAIVVSIPYLALLNYVSALPRPHLVSSTQFLVMRTDRLKGGEPLTFFVSSRHAIESAHDGV